MAKRNQTKITKTVDSEELKAVVDELSSINIELNVGLIDFNCFYCQIRDLILLDYLCYFDVNYDCIKKCFSIKWNGDVDLLNKIPNIKELLKFAIQIKSSTGLISRVIQKIANQQSTIKSLEEQLNQNKLCGLNPFNAYMRY